MELSIKFNQYSITSFPKALVGFNNLWTHLFFKEFNWVSMSKITSPPFQVESWTGFQGSLIFCSSRRNFTYFFQFPYLTYFRIYIFDLCTIVFLKAFSSKLFFLSQRESHSSVSNMTFWIPALRKVL